MSAPYETLRVETFDHVQLLTLNRPAAGNAISLAMAEELNHWLWELYVDAGATRCVVLTGAGERIFCGGGDMKERATMAPPAVRRQRALMERLIRQIADSPVPILAAVNGAAVGAGCEIVAAVDFAYASEAARFSLPEVRRGISPGAGATQTIPRACGIRRAKEMILTGAMFSAGEALDWGLVNKVVPASDLLKETLAVAHSIASNAPLAVRQAKQALDVASDTDFATGFRFELVAHAPTARSRDRQEAIAAFAEKREPVFHGE
ncbi:enoyl-CoA hydratase/isomerase family protein [Ancylobacter dichloromethanicus]|uniref:3-hydroxybutyryl-CoA dehydratase n=1 Tax=Ancylobacter dichloromethanicus TaxID=518825 RepID=A0A9W6MZ49_9HYPH|nr:enoyl-CoA hydratase-related protein [Ancylobacter dichloromethanicus]MBS7554733.1 enoyl-CoA hydratase/isomerase family protein [Ancylobacter dichloromethanicus]GLK72339.1 3-hydroxybutyryl-CoA dehydratase [Ancylobacter dichloromethanicus]